MQNATSTSLQDIQLSKVAYTLTIKVIPSSREDRVIGWEGDRLKIRLRAAPEKGKANTALIAFLSQLLDIPRTQIELVRGETARLKQVKLLGLSKEDILGIIPKQSDPI